jgi:hypothetical protein
LGAGVAERFAGMSGVVWQAGWGLPPSSLRSAAYGCAQGGWAAMSRSGAGAVTFYTTIWIPAASVKSVRLGFWRLQRCPVGRHWSIVTPVKESDLTQREQQMAHENKDIRLP